MGGSDKSETAADRKPADNLEMGEFSLRRPQCLANECAVFQFFCFCVISCVLVLADFILHRPVDSQQVSRGWAEDIRSLIELMTLRYPTHYKVLSWDIVKIRILGKR